MTELSHDHLAICPICHVVTGARPCDKPDWVPYADNNRQFCKRGCFNEICSSECQSQAMINLNKKRRELQKKSHEELIFKHGNVPEFFHGLQFCAWCDVCLFVQYITNHAEYIKHLIWMGSMFQHQSNILMSDRERRIIVLAHTTKDPAFALYMAQKIYFTLICNRFYTHLTDVFKEDIVCWAIRDALELRLDEDPEYYTYHLNQLLGPGKKKQTTRDWQTTLVIFNMFIFGHERAYLWLCFRALYLMETWPNQRRTLLKLTEEMKEVSQYISKSDPNWTDSKNAKLNRIMGEMNAKISLQDAALQNNIASLTRLGLKWRELQAVDDFGPIKPLYDPVFCSSACRESYEAKMKKKIKI